MIDKIDLFLSHGMRASKGFGDGGNLDAVFENIEDGIALGCVVAYGRDTQTPEGNHLGLIAEMLPEKRQDFFRIIQYIFGFGLIYI